MNAFVNGIGDALWALPHLASQPRLWRYVLIPAAIAGVPLAFLWVGYGTIRSATVLALGWLPTGVAEVASSAETLAASWALSLTYFLFVAVLAVVTTPFCEMLSEVVERDLSGQPPPKFTVLGLARDVVLGLVHASRRALAYLATIAGLFVLGAIVPVIGNALYLAGSLYMTARFTAYDALDTVWARKAWGYRAKMDWLATHRARAYALGAVVGALLAVPGVNLLAMPVGAVAATRQFLRVEAGPTSQGR
jgi:uncharacterized protein involved in cysteine biosynthesis